MQETPWDRIYKAASSGATQLDLANFGMTCIHHELFKLTKLETLDLSGNHLESIDSSIRTLTGLRTLHLNGNKIAELPNELFELSELQTLHLHDNSLVSLPRAIGKLRSLITLSLYNNKLKEIPAEIGNLLRLTILSLYNNKISTLPTSIKQLKSLVNLNVAHNQIDAIPLEIGKLTNLKRLYFANNRIKSIPRDLSSLNLLEGLYLDGNQLTDLDEGLFQLERLIELTLHGNVELAIPDSILGPSYEEVHKQYRTPSRPYDILRFYFDKKNAKERLPLNAVKVMLVGDADVGKTSLRRFFLGQPHEPLEPETLGIARDAFRLETGGKKYNVSLWDFAGQEITHALHQFFLTEGCVYLLVVQPRSDNAQNDLIRWLKQIERYGGNSPVIVVLNKQDLRTYGYDVDRCYLRERFPFIQEFVSTVCGIPEVRKGCDYLLEQLGSVVSEMPEANDSVPANWINIMDELSFDVESGQNSKNYISFPDFRSLCSRHGESDNTKQESLARILHKLGTIVHFMDEPKLRDTTILNPHWVTDGTYRLLRHKDGPNSNGVITLEEAMAALPGVNIRDVEFLLDLMERFEMCFRVDENSSQAAARWLIPGALPPNQPADLYVKEWDTNPRSRIRYVYDPLPQSVIPRLIVMTHALNENELSWRNGVVLKKGLARALVRRAGTENTIEVTVQGIDVGDGVSKDFEREEHDRLTLIKIIRGAFERIHRDLPVPGPRELTELSDLPDEYRYIDDLKASETLKIPIAVAKKTGGAEQRDATIELNKLSDPAPRNSRKKPLRVFLSYAHQDRNKQKLFRQNLLALEGDKYITFWDDPNIVPGMEWRVEIQRELESMDVFIGLYTTNFRASKFIDMVEFRRATERPELNGRLWLVWVDRHARIEGTKYEQFQFVKPGNKAVSEFKTLREGFDAVECEIHQRIVSIWNLQSDSD